MTVLGMLCFVLILCLSILTVQGQASDDDDEDQDVGDTSGQQGDSGITFDTMSRPAIVFEPHENATKKIPNRETPRYYGDNDDETQTIYLRPKKRKILLKRKRPEPGVAEANHRLTSASNHNQGEIVYEDEVPSELSDWIPPPPPPPPEALFRPARQWPLRGSSSNSQWGTVFNRGQLQTQNGRIFGEDFALFLVILTIAGFFGLMLAMFMPFTFLLQQPYGGLGGGTLGYPAGAAQGFQPQNIASGYPPYGRRRRDLKQDILGDRIDNALQMFLKVLDSELSSEHIQRPTRRYVQVETVLEAPPTTRLRSW
ncbi:hypothetical protein HDE_00827 [Halotydeus destructor]|nr:hypothetical protein HDE_00827 [Halotydeus destructor]